MFYNIELRIENIDCYDGWIKKIFIIENYKIPQSYDKYEFKLITEC